MKPTSSSRTHETEGAKHHEEEVARGSEKKSAGGTPRVKRLAASWKENGANDADSAWMRSVSQPHSSATAAARAGKRTGGGGKDGTGSADILLAQLSQMSKARTGNVPQAIQFNDVSLLMGKAPPVRVAAHQTTANSRRPIKQGSPGI
jgi:hypothetical protein